MRYNELGQELPDSTPIAVPAHFKRPPTLQEQIKSLIRTELSQQAAEQDRETFDEADDFDIDEDTDLPYSKHEIQEMQEETPREAFKALVEEPKAPALPKAKKAKKEPSAEPVEAQNEDNEQ